MNDLVWSCSLFVLLSQGAPTSRSFRHGPTHSQTTQLLHTQLQTEGGETNGTVSSAKATEVTPKGSCTMRARLLSSGGGQHRVHVPGSWQKTLEPNDPAAPWGGLMVSQLSTTLQDTFRRSLKVTSPILAYLTSNRLHYVLVKEPPGFLL